MRTERTNTTALGRRVLAIIGAAILFTPRMPAQTAASPAPELPSPPPARLPLPPGVVRPTAARTFPAAAPAPAFSAAAPGTNAAAPRARYQPSELSAALTGDAEARAPELKFENSPSDIVLQTYARETGRTLLIAPDAPKANISLRSQTPLNRREYLLAIQTVLRMNNIALLPVGDKFLKVVPASAVLANAIDTEFQEPGSGEREDRGEIISQMVQLRYISIDEASKAIAPFKRGEGQVQVFERTNSILLTDRTENVNRMMEIIRFLDQPHVVREEVNVRPIKYAKAASVKQRLDEIVAESQKATAGKATPQANTSGAPGIRSVTAPLPMPVPGVVRAPSLIASPANNPIIEALMAEAERGVIRGKVQILADERTNILIIITQPENMTFFDRIINVLDIETTPDVLVTVQRLEYADAEDVAKMLNDLIGNVKAEQPKGAGAGAAGTGAGAAGENKAGSSTSLADFAERLRAPTAAAAASAEPGKSKVGELNKDNVKILSNKRTNAIIIMASKSDTDTISDIIKDMDIRLSQVLIETVVLDVSLNSELSTGISWLQSAVESSHYGMSYMGSGGGGKGTPVNVGTFLGSTATNVLSSAAAGLQYFFSLPNININAVIQASSTDGRTKVLTSPVLLTQDNKEATIESTQLVYLNKGQTQTGTTSSGVPLYNANVDQRDVGLTVKVTPRINQKGMVVLHVDEKFENIAGVQQVPQTDSSGNITEESWPIIATRKLTADISMKSGETAILGGLVTTTKSKATTKVPLLGDIPFIGRYLFGSTDDKDDRTELLVFLTPYVLDTSEAMSAEARRRKDYLDLNGVWTKGWSDSKLADETPVQKLNREKAERAVLRAQERENGNSNQPPAVNAGVMSMTVTTNVVMPAASVMPDAPQGSR